MAGVAGGDTFIRARTPFSGVSMANSEAKHQAMYEGFPQRVGLTESCFCQKARAQVARGTNGGFWWERLADGDHQSATLSPFFMATQLLQPVLYLAGLFAGTRSSVFRFHAILVRKVSATGLGQCACAEEFDEFAWLPAAVYVRCDRPGMFTYRTRTHQDAVQAVLRKDALYGNVSPHTSG
ncbi:hypothetical protein CYMTET_16781 [Cymbomonas tetramitiformis]|uniref:Uncharacterized protein n=1 Tax=Cymbomonas tetramitiformis TaxID=36881 RepID=A0AAE0GBN3_9CHLO|nr:hypothetical protein CYMTET_16781 [Cymbomonas tetramitiformis]